MTFDLSKLQGYARQASRDAAAAIEQAAEMAVQGGLHGVMVTHSVVHGAGWAGPTVVKTTAEVSPEVPYGHIYYKHHRA